jgi:hypothetical protein
VPAPEDVRLRFIDEAACARHMQPVVDASVRGRPPSTPVKPQFANAALTQVS